MPDSTHTVPEAESQSVNGVCLGGSGRKMRYRGFRIAKARSQKFHQVLPCRYRSPSTCVDLCCFPRSTGRELDWKMRLGLKLAEGSDAEATRGKCQNTVCNAVFSKSLQHGSQSISFLLQAALTVNVIVNWKESLTVEIFDF